MSTKLVIAVLVVLFCIILLLVRLAESHRRKERLSRFADRDPIDLDELVPSSFPKNGDLIEPLRYWWNRAASILRIDPRLLRREDRFDEMLGPVKGHPVEDEVSELGDLVEEAAPASKELKSPLNTFGECVLYLAQHATIHDESVVPK